MLTGRRRIAWFADLEALVEDLSVLERLQGDIGLTTVAPESHLSHTSGFAASAEVAAESPLADWRARPGLRDHRDVFGVPEPAMAVLPGILGGVDDAPLLRVLDECRRLGLEVWGHAGLWSYGGEVFPEFVAVDLWRRPLTPGSLPWGTMFCPSKAPLNAWIARSLADVAGGYDLDGWFFDHARYTSPGHAQTLAACGCADCDVAARERGVELSAVRQDIEALGRDIRGIAAACLVDLATAGPVGLAGWLARRPGILAWFAVRAQILADRFADLAATVRTASPRPIDVGSDVFPPGVALLGGHTYSAWAAAGATYLTGGFTPKIGWGSVGRITATSLGEQLATLVPGLTDAEAVAVVATLLGLPEAQVKPAGLVGRPESTSEDDFEAYVTELRRIAAMRGDLPVYPPIAGPPEPEAIARMGDAIVDAGLDGAMIAGLESTTPEQRRAISRHLSSRLL